VRALVKTAEENGMSLDVLDAVEKVNARQKRLLLSKLIGELGDDLNNCTVAVWGLAFKAQTDDMRESPAVDLIQGLLNAGANVRAFDPKAAATARAVLGDRITYSDRQYDPLENADALVIVTEWMEFRNPAFTRMRSLLKKPIIVDGRNLYNPEKMSDLGFRYLSVGRMVVK
jgi:UDPglucose 6-dehydrogenase